MGLGILGFQLDSIFEFNYGFGIFAISKVSIASLDKRHFLGRRISPTPIGKQAESDQQDPCSTSLYQPFSQHVLLSFSSIL
jgi:hypothetical protein